MRREFEDDPPDLGSFTEREDYRDHPSLGAGMQQSPETLREGYPWIEHFRKEHPGYRFAEYPSPPDFGNVPELIDARVALITTAGVYREDQRCFSVSPGEVEPEYLRQRFRHMGDSTFRTISAPLDETILRIAYPDLDLSGAERDINTVFPIARLLALEEESYIGSAAKCHISFMGYIPNPSGLNIAALEVCSLLAEDEVNLVLFSPADVLSHQTMAILQRAVEASGIPTISVALCKDVVDSVGVPRAVHYRFPFGFTFGDPNDEAMQLRILKETLRASTEIQEAGEIVELPYQWLEL